MTDIVLYPGETPLANWMAIYRGTAVRLDRSCRPGVEQGVEAAARIVDAGKPVYDINIGFGKLATVRRLTRQHAGHLDDDRYLHANMEKKARTLVWSGEVIAVLGGIALPKIARRRS